MTATTPAMTATTSAGRSRATPRARDVSSTASSLPRSRARHQKARPRWHGRRRLRGDGAPHAIKSAQRIRRAHARHSRRQHRPDESLHGESLPRRLCTHRAEPPACAVSFARASLTLFLCDERRVGDERQHSAHNRAVQRASTPYAARRFRSACAMTATRCSRRSAAPGCAYVRATISFPSSATRYRTRALPSPSAT
jgi:hypothetical protein